MSTRTNAFARGAASAAEYDAWYDSAAGAVVLHAEQRAVRALLDGAERPWLDVGTGSGRFGGDLGAEVGLDPAPALLAIAARRMPSVVLGVAEALPFRDANVGAVLSVAVFEFLAAPAEAMREIARVLRPGGRFVLGFFARTGAWAAAYERQGSDPQSVFHGARFFSVDEVETLGAAPGLQRTGARSALFEAPGVSPAQLITMSAEADAGFVALSLTKP
ncbi:MAG: class I SAM-dependent methyltransferase [Dehalococcoidia bacterium]